MVKSKRKSNIIKRSKEEWVRLFESFENSGLKLSEFLDGVSNVNRRTFDKNYQSYKQNKENFLKLAKKVSVFNDVDIDKEALYREAVAVKRKGYLKLKKDIEEIKKSKDKEMFEELANGNFFV